MKREFDYSILFPHSVSPIRSSVSRCVLNPSIQWLVSGLLKGLASGDFWLILVVWRPAALGQ